MRTKTHKWSVTTRIGGETEQFLADHKMKVSALLDLAPTWWAEREQIKEDYEKLVRQRDVYMRIAFDKDKELTAAKKLIQKYARETR